MFQFKVYAQSMFTQQRITRMVVARSGTAALAQVAAELHEADFYATQVVHMGSVPAHAPAACAARLAAMMGAV